MGVPATEDVAEALRNATVTCNDQVLRQLLVHASAALQRESERATAAEARATAAETALQHERHRSDGVLREIKDELRSVHSYARRTHTTLTSAVTKSGQLYNALASSHNKSIVNPRGRRLQPGIALLDTSNCPTQRRIYGDAWPRMVKMIEGQRGKHIHTTINTLTEEGAVLLREYEYYPNGITHRDNLKGSLDGWLESKVSDCSHKQILPLD